MILLAIIFFIVFLSILILIYKKPVLALCIYAIFIPPLSISGLNIPLLGRISSILGIILVIGLFFSFLVRRLKIILSPLSIPFICFIIASLISFLISGQDFKNVLLLIYYFGLHLSVYNMLKRFPNLEKISLSILSSFSISVIIVAVLGISSWYIGWPRWESVATFRTPDLVIARLQGPSSNPNSFAYFFILGLPIIIALVLISTKPIRKYFWLLGMCLSLIALILTFSRGAYIGVFCSICLIMIFNIKNRKIKNLAMLMLIFSLLLPRSLFNLISVRIRTIGMLSGDIARTEQLQGALKAFIKSPIWGAGLGKAEEVILFYIPTALAPYPHSNILMTMVQMGIIGLVPLLIILYKMIAVPLKRCADSTEMQRILLLGLSASNLGFFIQGLFTMNLHWSAIWFLSGISFALSQYNIRRK